jgi:SAM-dependent methyltransferase
MPDASSSYPRIWDGWAATLVFDEGAVAGTRTALPDFASRLYASEAMNPAAPAASRQEGMQPYTLQWFLEIENQRHGRQGRWIPRLLEFGKHAGETLLGLGDGLGTDWLQYARHGASVVVCSAVREQLGLVKRNFELRSLVGRFLHAKPTELPLESDSVDVACVSGLLDQAADPPAVVREIYRVLKPGGKVLSVTPARYDVDFWQERLLPWLSWLGRKRELEPGLRFSARGLRRLFAGFEVHRIHKRHLRRSEVPQPWRLLPMGILERLLGRVLVLKAFKPISAAICVPLAA